MTPSKPSRAAIEAVFLQLSKLYPDTRTELTYRNEWELIVAVILSAQCTDKRVNLTTPALFARFPTPESLAAAKPREVEKLIHSCGFYRQKTKSIQSASADLVEKFGGKLPRTIEELTQLRGVGRKTASVVLNQAFGIPAIAVDTHVKRVSLRLGWATHPDPEKIEFELRELLPEKYWAQVNGMLILHGRRVCNSRKPECHRCPVSSYCVFFKTLQTKAPSARELARNLPVRPLRNRATGRSQTRATHRAPKSDRPVSE